MLSSTTLLLALNTTYRLQTIVMDNEDMDGDSAQTSALVQVNEDDITRRYNFLSHVVDISIQHAVKSSAILYAVLHTIKKEQV